MNSSVVTVRALFAATALVTIALATGGGTAVGAPESSRLSAGTLELRASLRLVSTLGSACPPGTAPATDCPTRSGVGLVPGLGRVTEAYAYPIAVGPPVCAENFARVFGYSVRLVVVGKGEVRASVGEAQCVPREVASLTQAQAFTITGGTGVYAGASGAGTIERRLGFTDGGAAGIETWSGTVSVPGLDFDVAPPTLTGAVARSVRAPRTARRVRVIYSVHARDEVDGVLPVSCRPRSGSRFAIGRTVVTCSAMDSSGNTRSARFVVTVRRR